MNRKILFSLALACALSAATLLGATLALGGFMAWLSALPPVIQRLIQPLSMVAVPVFVALGLVLRRPAEAEPDDER